MLTIVQAETAGHISTARELMVEYATWLEYNLCFQGFEEEMRSLPGKYAPPSGRLLLALWHGRPAGVIALRALEEPGLCEMKRLYVRPEFRGHRIGRVLAERVIGEAAEIGYSRMRLDTIPGKMDSAIAMYRELGFRKTGPYYDTPVATLCLWSWRSIPLRESRLPDSCGNHKQRGRSLPCAICK